MTQYDNTDRGAVFPPREGQKMILSGRANNNGEEMNLVVTMSSTKDGKQIMDVYQKVGTLFVNDKRGKDTAPDFTGPFKDRRVSCWTKKKDDMKYMSLSFSDKRENTQQTIERAPDPLDDEIPFG